MSYQLNYVIHHKYYWSNIVQLKTYFLGIILQQIDKWIISKRTRSGTTIAFPNIFPRRMLLRLFSPKWQPMTSSWKLPSRQVTLGNCQSWLLFCLYILSRRNIRTVVKCVGSSWQFSSWCINMLFFCHLMQLYWSFELRLV